MGYKLKLCENKARGFLLCLALSAEEKRFSLVFPRGMGTSRGWKTFATKLRSIKVVSMRRHSKTSKESFRRLEEKGGDTHLEHASFVEVLNRGKRDVGEAIWIESETKEVMSNLVFLKGGGMFLQAEMPDIDSLKF